MENARVQYSYSRKYSQGRRTMVHSELSYLKLALMTTIYKVFGCAMCTVGLIGALEQQFWPGALPDATNE